MQLPFFQNLEAEIWQFLNALNLLCHACTRVQRCNLAGASKDWEITKLLGSGIGTANEILTLRAMPQHRFGDLV